jgi:hypothetical protein
VGASRKGSGGPNSVTLKFLALHGDPTATPNAFLVQILPTVRSLKVKISPDAPVFDQVLAGDEFATRQATQQAALPKSNGSGASNSNTTAADVVTERQRLGPGECLITVGTRRIREGWRATITVVPCDPELVDEGEMQAQPGPRPPVAF